MCQGEPTLPPDPTQLHNITEVTQENPPWLHISEGVQNDLPWFHVPQSAVILIAQGPVPVLKPSSIPPVSVLVLDFKPAGFLTAHVTVPISEPAGIPSSPAPVTASKSQRHFAHLSSCSCFLACRCTYIPCSCPCL